MRNRCCHLACPTAVALMLLARVAPGQASAGAAGLIVPDAADREAVLRAIDRAEGFLRSLAPRIDPVRLRTRHAMRGKKFYVEYLSAWWSLGEIGDAQRRTAIREWLRPIVARTEDDAYHNLAAISDDEFRQDAISYLNGCVLHLRLGFDVVRYCREVERILPRLLSPEHLRRRGVDNTMGIVFRLRQLGFGGGPTFCQLWQRPDCVTRRHPDLTKVNLDDPMARTIIYDMTHEIFFLTEFGETPMQCVSEPDLRYIRRMHAALIPALIEKANADTLAELIMDLNYLRMTDLPEYAAGYRFLLKCQNADGSWGNHDQIERIVSVALRVNPDYLADVGQYLHTTGVTIEALTYPLRPHVRR